MDFCIILLVYLCSGLFTDDVVCTIRWAALEASHGIFRPTPSSFDVNLQLQAIEPLPTIRI